MSLRSNQTRGFTLIELMVVAAIVAILGAIAFPSYVDYVRKARMVDAQMVLLEAAQWMERQYTLNNQYPNALPADLSRSPKGTGTKYYDLARSSGSATTYTLTATPVSPQAWRGCVNLTINHLGVRGVQGGTASAADCWP